MWYFWSSSDEDVPSNPLDNIDEQLQVIMESTEQPNSICHVTASQIYQLPHSKFDPPFALLQGEAVLYHGKTVEGLIVLTNYRLFLQEQDYSLIIPLGLIDIIDVKELLEILIWSKNGPTYRIKFDTNSTCTEWYNHIYKNSFPPKQQLEETFAFIHYFYSKENLTELVQHDCNENYVYNRDALMKEVNRLNFIKHGTWRISERNVEYTLCPSYPSHIIVPSYVDDLSLDHVAKFRGARRIPTIVWRHQGNGAIIARSSQPEVGLLYWRSKEDEEYLKAIAYACSFDRGQRCMLDSMSSHSPTSTDSEGSTQVPPPYKEYKKVLIMDARSYSTAIANRARGGGCEYEEYYTTCEMKFMGLANIHAIRNSFKSLRALCEQSNPATWYATLESSAWLQYMSTLMGAAVAAAEAIDQNAQPVLVHCSDGWDRTPQIVSLTELLLDPYYRTVEGFRVLVEREWLAYGHKFADRCGQPNGSADVNERCPIFLQWLDCVHQLLVQFPTSFEFTQNFLIKLAHHTYSGMFGTFLCNTRRERAERVDSATFSVWSYLKSPWFRNHLYVKPRNVRYGVSPIWPLHNVRDLHFWSALYLGALEIKNKNRRNGPSACPGPPLGDEVGSSSPMTKTRSYGDLTSAGDSHPSSNRRRSDPSITVDIAATKSSDLPQAATASAPSSSHQSQAEAIADDPSLQAQSYDQNCSDDCIFKDDLLETVRLLKALEISREDTAGSCDDVDGSKGLPKGAAVAEEDDRLPKTAAVEDSIQVVDNLVDATGQYSSVVISKQKTDEKNEKDLAAVGGSVSSREEEAGDINRLNGNLDENDDVTVAFDIPASVETSTETLTLSDNHNKAVSSSLTKPMITNGFDTNLNLYDGNVDICCKDCFIQSIKINNGKFISCNSNNNSERNSRYSTPLYSRTPSGNNWENTLNSLSQHQNQQHTQQQQQHHQQPPQQHRQSSRYSSIEDDGLRPYRCMVQERLDQIIEEHQKREEELQREIQTLKEALLKQTRQQCGTEGERPDDASSSHAIDEGESDDRADGDDVDFPIGDLPTPLPAPNYEDDALSPVACLVTNSVVESVNSAGEGQASAVESLRSDVSWEAVEEGPVTIEGLPTLWVPDHAVSRCTGCQSQFWLGRRKHHCRNCGRIFCSNCSDYSTPLPSEQLYSPVRVCTPCYSKLRRDCGEIPDRCKHIGPQTTNTNPRITASSN